MRGQDTGTMRFLAGLLLGSIVGAGVSLLVAPEMANDARRRVRMMGHRLAKESTDAFERVKDEIDPTIERVSGQVKNKVDQVKKDLNGRNNRSPA